MGVRMGGALNYSLDAACHESAGEDSAEYDRLFCFEIPQQIVHFCWMV